MSSIWTDLLSLHGYLARRDDLAWRDDGTVRRKQEEADAGNVDPAHGGAPARKRRLLPWPRLAAPH